MKKMKKAAAIILCVILAVSAAGCIPGAGNGSSDGSALENILLWPFKLIRSMGEAAGALSEASEEAGKSVPEKPDGIPGEKPDGNPDAKDAEEENSADAGDQEPEESGADAGDQEPGEQKESPEKDTEGAESASFMPAYYHYDKADFEPLIDALEDAAKAGDEDALEEAYEAAYRELLTLDDLYASIDMLYANDVSNKENDEEMNYTKSVLIDCEDRLSTAVHNILEKEENGAFGDYLGDRLADYFLDYLPMTDEVKKLYDQVTDLETDYNAELNRINEYAYEYNGREWTIKDLNDEAIGQDFVKTDVQGYLEVYNGILKSFNDVVCPIYVKIVDLNNQIARSYGYDSYADYAYEKVYARDYNPEDAAAYCDVIKTSVAPNYYQYVYYGGAYSENIDYESSLIGLFSALDHLSKEISPLAAKAYQLLTEEKLYDVGYEDERLNGAFTSYLSGKQLPYIFAHLSGEAYDLVTMTHEFGHFTYFSQMEDYNYFLSAMNLDLMEMHSNGFEGLCTKYYDEFFGAQADSALHYTLAEILANVVDGCVQDEFQRRVYAEKELDPDKVNSIYTEVANSYGAFSFGDVNYEWCLIPHTFSSPFYYLSYSVSGLTSLEIWDIAQEDYEKAVEAWEKLVDLADENKGCFKTLEECGLHTIRDTEDVKSICGTVLARFGAPAGGEYDIEQWLKEILEDI